MACAVTWREELAEETNRFSNEGVALLKFHGIYQQEDRDARQDRKAAGVEKAYKMMVRSRIPGGVLTAEQYLAQDDLAGRYANGTLRITTRQGFQLHGVLKGDLQPTIAAINEALLSTLAACGDVNRNVMACPAPVASRAQAQVQEIAHTIAMHLAPTQQRLPRDLDGRRAGRTVEAPPAEADEPIYGAHLSAPQVQDRRGLPRRQLRGHLHPGHRPGRRSWRARRWPASPC